MTYYVYILQAGDGTFYTGQTKDPENRLKRHNAGRVRSTKIKTPWRIVHTERFATRTEAMKREKQIKARKSRAYIESLVRTSRA